MELSAYSQDGTIALYFVLPENCKAEECTKTLIYAFQACREHELEPAWISTEECLKIIPTKQDVFVCDPFDGEAFKYFMSVGFKCVVLGPRCLLTCLHSKKPVPELPSPLHNMAMHGIVATSTGFEKEAKAKLQDHVERMCGIYSNSFHEGITHLIANVVGTKKYLVAVEKETPIMSDEWVKAVWKATNEESYANVTAIQDQFSNYTCPVFKGLVICVSQLPRKEKDALKSLVEVNGGIYAANLEMSVTSVLISPSSEGEKYKHALQWRIPCLTQEWIYDSLENGHALPWDAYKIQKKPKASTPTNDLSIRAPPDVSICSTIMNETVMNNTVNVDETVEQDISLFLKKTPNPQVLAGVAALENLDLQKVLHAGLFLDGCKIFVSGFEANLQEKLRRILNAGGATRFNTLTDAATHVVIGKVIEEHLSAVRAMSIKPHVVTADWLVECANEGRPVDEEKFSYLKSESSHKELSPPPPALTTDKGFARPNDNRIDESKDETAIDVDLINQYLGSSKGKTPRRISMQENTMDCSTLPDSQESTNSGIFRGKIFTISGYADQIEEQLEELICGNGGEVVDINCSRVVTFSVVSVDGEGLFHPKALNYITHIFLEDCLEQECLVPVEYFHMPFIWPSHSSVLSNCVIATSSYKGKERPFVNHIASKLGATCQDMFARKDNPSKNVKSSTHLLCPSPEGSKYVAAKKWGVPAITKDWVFKCAANGYKVLEEPFSVDSRSPEEVDCKEVLISLLDKAGKLPKDSVVLSALGMNGSLSAPIALDRKVKEIRNQHNVEQINIQTPDSETIRRMYPTPGCRPANESLDAMPTPDTPYGSTWFANPSSRIRKGFKRALDALPDDVSTKRRLAGPETPDEVYFNKYTERLKEVIANHPLPKPPSGEILACAESEEGEVQVDAASDPAHPPESLVNVTTKPSDYGPLYGVVVYASKKLSNSQQELYRTVAELGGDYRWTYDSSVTHLLHYGRMNDTNREFRIAKENGKVIVAPDWVWMCRDEGKRVDESLFPHVHNPKMSLSIISTKSTPSRKKRGRPKLLKDTCTPRETPLSEEESAEEEEEDQVLEDGPRTPSNLSKEELARQLEELETLALVTGAGPKRTPNTTNRSKSVGIVEKINTPGDSSTQQRATGTTEPESQGTAITWDDPQEREARARLQVALVGETEDILAERKDDEMKEDYKENTPQKLNSACASSRRPQKYVFALSGMDEERVDYINMIHHLGGSVVDNKAFDLSITHIITLKPTRSEKHLAAIASGRWILYKSFLECSISAEHFVDEELHEWGNEKAISLPTVKKDSLEEKLAFAAHRWRVHFDEFGRGAFHGMKVVFFSSKERVEAFTRLVEAGGGQVIKNIKEDIDEVTHCFVELSKAPKVDLALFASKQIPCILPMYLNNLLISFPPPDEMESCIPEYKEIILNMTTPVPNLARRSKRKGSNN